MMDSLVCCGPIETRDDGDTNSEIGSGMEHDGKILECDYDATCTKLYKMIENKKWEEITYFLETGKWYFDTSAITSMIFGPGPDPRFVESRTWVTALDELGSVRWCQLPLHAAITFQAPYDVITKLVEVYPESIRCADDQDMLPLHYAFRFGSDDRVLSYVLDEFPKAMKKKALRGRLPLDMAHYSSRPERGVIIELYVDSAIEDANVDSKCDQKENEKLHRELSQARKKIQDMEQRLRVGKVGSLSGRNSVRRSQRSLKEVREESLQGSEEIDVDRQSKGFRKKKLEKAKARSKNHIHVNL